MIVTFPNGTTATSIASGTYTPATGISPVPATVFKDKDIQQTLIGLSDLCHSGQEVRLTETALEVISNGHTLLHVDKLPTDRLWTFPRTGNNIESETQNRYTAASVIRNDLQSGYVKFWSAALGSPADSTLIQALSLGYLGNLPRLTAKMVRRHRPNSIATAKGHLDRQRQGMQSTRPKKSKTVISEREVCDDIDWDSKLYTWVVHRTEQENHTDLSGRFPVTSIHGNNYMLMSVYKNHIRAVAMKTKEQESYLRAYRETYAFYKALGITPLCQRLDNETSVALEKFFQDEVKVDFQYVPPQSHRRNKAERAMRTMKNHLLSTFATAHENCPLFLWDEALVQENITINLLRPWADDITISAYEGMYRSKYDFLAHPLAPFGTKVLVYETPDERKTWADHGVPGYYVGPSAHSYRTFRVYVTKTRGFRDAETLSWFPEDIHMPGSNAHETLLAAINMLNESIQYNVHHDIRQDYVQLSQLLQDSLTLYHGPEIASRPAGRTGDLRDKVNDMVQETGVVVPPSCNIPDR